MMTLVTPYLEDCISAVEISASCLCPSVVGGSWRTDQILKVPRLISIAMYLP
jgi:hypothetical protein